MTDRALSDEEIRARLSRDLPAWRHEDGQIRRTIRTRSWKGTMLAVGAIGHLAEAAWHHPDLLVTFSSVEVRLSTHDAGGITEKDFELAAKIEEVVLWKPEGGALEGTPDTDRHGYVVRG